MPVRLSNSSVLRWPDRSQVDRAARVWASQAAVDHPELIRAGYFGSYSRGDWGVGSDLDLLVIVGAALEPFPRRPLLFNTLDLPVPAELLVYTGDEWGGLLKEGRAFARRVAEEVTWVYERGEEKPA